MIDCCYSLCNQTLYFPSNPYVFPPLDTLTAVTKTLRGFLFQIFEEYVFLQYEVRRGEQEMETPFSETLPQSTSPAPESRIPLEEDVAEKQ